MERCESGLIDYLGKVATGIPLRQHPHGRWSAVASGRIEWVPARRWPSLLAR
jgi:hypothetical protein